MALSLGTVPEFNHPRTPNLRRLAEHVRSLVMVGAPLGQITRRGPLGVEIGPIVGLDHHARRKVRQLNRPDRVVIVSEEPKDGDFTLTVREVRFRHTPPQPIEHPRELESDELAAVAGSPYEIASDAFTAYPDFGSKAVEYADAYWSIQDRGSPGFEATYLRATHFKGEWIVLRPQGQVSQDWCVVRDIPNTDEAFLDVQFIVPTNTDPWDGSYTTRGDVARVLAQPFAVGRHYVPYVSSEEPLTHRSSPLPAVKVGRTWYVLQLGRRGSIDLDPGVQFGDCVGPMVGAPA